jgi:hypothetical protein
VCGARACARHQRDTERGPPFVVDRSNRPTHARPLAPIPALSPPQSLARRWIRARARRGPRRWAVARWTRAAVSGFFRGEGERGKSSEKSRGSSAELQARARRGPTPPRPRAMPGGLLIQPPLPLDEWLGRSWRVDAAAAGGRNHSFFGRGAIALCLSPPLARALRHRPPRPPRLPLATSARPKLVPDPLGPAGCQEARGRARFCGRTGACAWFWREGGASAATSPRPISAA